MIEYVCARSRTHVSGCSLALALRSPSRLRLELCATTALAFSRCFQRLPVLALLMQLLAALTSAVLCPRYVVCSNSMN